MNGAVPMSEAEPGVMYVRLELLAEANEKLTAALDAAVRMQWERDAARAELASAREEFERRLAAIRREASV